MTILLIKPTMGYIIYIVYNMARKRALGAMENLIKLFVIITITTIIMIMIMIVIITIVILYLSQDILWAPGEEIILSHVYTEKERETSQQKFETDVVVIKSCTWTTTIAADKFIPSALHSFKSYRDLSDLFSVVNVYSPLKE